MYLYLFLIVLASPLSVYCSERLDGKEGWRGISRAEMEAAISGIKTQRSLYSSGSQNNYGSYQVKEQSIGDIPPPSNNIKIQQPVVLALDTSKNSGYTLGGSGIANLASLGGGHGLSSLGSGHSLSSLGSGHTLSLSNDLSGLTNFGDYGKQAFSLGGLNLPSFNFGASNLGHSYGQSYGSGGLHFGSDQHTSGYSVGSLSHLSNLPLHNGGYVSGISLGQNLGGSGGHQSIISLPQSQPSHITVSGHESNAQQGGAHDTSSGSKIQIQSTKPSLPTKLHASPDIQHFGHKYGKSSLQDFGEVSHNKKPLTKLVKVIKTYAVKVPVAYPVKVPQHVPVPVPVHKPYPVHVQQIVKVPHPVPVEVPVPVGTKAEHPSAPQYGAQDYGAPLSYQHTEYANNQQTDYIALTPHQMSELLGGGQQHADYQQLNYGHQTADNQDTASQDYGHSQSQYTQQQISYPSGEQHQASAQQIQHTLHNPPSIDTYNALASIKQSIESGLHLAQQDYPQQNYAQQNYGPSSQTESGSSYGQRKSSNYEEGQKQETPNDSQQSTYKQ